MRILYVWDSEYPWDVRTEKVCATLTAHGHSVVIAARNRKGDRREEQLPEGLVERLPILPAAVRSPLSFPAFFNPLWLFHLRNLTRRHRIEVVIVRDLPLAPAALHATAGLPVLLDMAENYPAMIEDIWTDQRHRPWDILVRNPRIVSAIERYAIRRMDHIWTVVEESRERLLSMGIAPERVSVVSNTPPASAARDTGPKETGGPLRVVYLGLMERHRGVGDLLDALAMLSRKGMGFRADLVGDGRDLDRFQAQATELGLTPSSVVFHGRLPHAEALGIVRAAQVGVVPHHARESWNTTIPNKLFDYMAAGLAVVSSDALPAARILRETGAGVIFRSGDFNDFAERLESMGDSVARERMRACGQNAIRTTYNWEADSTVLLRTVEALGRSTSDPGRM